MVTIPAHRDSVRLSLSPGLWRLLPGAAAGVDLLIVVATLIVVPQVAPGAVPPAILTGAAVVGWVLMVWALGGYQVTVLDAGTEEFRRVARASVAAATVAGTGLFITDAPLEPRMFVATFAIGTPALLAGRAGMRQAVRRMRRAGALLQSAVVVGTPESADHVAGVLAREQHLGFRVLGALTPLGAESATPRGVPILGDCADVAKRVHELGADLVFFADGGVSSQDMRAIAWELEKSEVRVVVAPSVSEVSGERVRIQPIGGLPLIHVDPPRANDAVRWGKRFFDICGATALLVLASPLLLFAYLRIKFDDGGPAVFSQTRVGQDGHEFTCVKFRTMVPDAEALLPSLKAEIGHDGGLFKMEDDPRITKAGRFLRRYSIDELPQLVNVLRGEMSLVGPRPPLPCEVATYDERARRRLRVRPGLTGLWQVSGRSNLEWEEALRLDLYYVDNWSMLQDIWILIRTLRAVAEADGAY